MKQQFSSPQLQFLHITTRSLQPMHNPIRECGSTLYVGMPRKQNGHRPPPIHYIAKSFSQANPNDLLKPTRNHCYRFL